MKDKKTVYYIGGAVLAYLFIIRPVLQKFGIIKTKDQIIRDKEKEQFLNQEGTPTKTPGEWAIIADQIYENLRYTALSDNKADAGYQVSRVKNSADFALLYKAFGKRREYAFGIPAGSEKDLAQFIRTNLSNSAIQIINNNYRLKGIKFQY